MLEYESNPYGFTPESLTFSAQKAVNSSAYLRLTHCQRYYACSQHDAKRYDFDGRMIQAGSDWQTLSQPFLSMAKSDYYVPLKKRRPSAPYRIGRKIVNSFTNMVFGEGRFPDVVVSGDEDTQEFVKALIEETKLELKMSQLRTLGGSVGKAGLSWCYHDGLPYVQVHNGKNIYVHEWASKHRNIPKHVTEVYQYPKTHWDSEKKRLVTELWWHRQDWTLTADVVYEDCKVQGSAEPQWVIDESATAIHNDGFCHFVYVENLPAIEGNDGITDYDGVYEQMDMIDMLMSVIARGGINNLDPTLKLKMDPEIIDGGGSFQISKGSDNAIVTGKDGDASYLELGGTSITSGLQLYETMRQQVLETTECVIPDPDKIAAAGTSSVALKMLYAPMLGKCGNLRTQYGDAILELLRQMLTVAQRMYEPKVEQDEGGEEVEVVSTLQLKDVTWDEPILDEEGNPSGEYETKSRPQHPGECQSLELSWGPYFNPTSDDQQKTSALLTQATSGQQFCSTKTATEVFAGVLGRDPIKMVDELVKESEAREAEQQAQFASMGVEPGAPEVVEAESLDDLPMADAPDSISTSTNVDLTSADTAAIVSVNEARKSIGLGPLIRSDGSVDPDGFITVSEFKAKKAESIAMAAAADKGEVIQTVDDE
jgi:hypothetical protein